MEKYIIDISLSLDDLSREQRFSEEIEIASYRFIQECLNNSVKHSGSKLVKIKISLEDSILNLSVQDFGKGFNSELVEKRIF